MTARTSETTTINGERVKLRVPRDNDHVTATVRENLWAGVGAGVIVLCGSGTWVLATTATLSDVNVAAAVIAGGVTFGVLSVARFSLDEWRDLRDRLRMENMLVDLTMERDDLRSKLVKAFATIKELRQQLAVLSAAGGTKAKAVATPDTLSLVYDNARLLAERWSANLPYSRDEMRSSLTDGEWNAAMSLMERAGVVGRGGLSGKKRLIVGDSYDAVLRSVETRISQERADAQTRFVRA